MKRLELMDIFFVVVGIAAFSWFVTGTAHNFFSAGNEFMAFRINVAKFERVMSVEKVKALRKEHDKELKKLQATQPKVIKK